MTRYNFTSEAIFNLDESDITTAHKPDKVLAPTGLKQVGQVTSGERGILITMLACINAAGKKNSVPPLFVFPRVNFKNVMLTGAPVGSIGAANKSGWITGDIFLTFLHHFIKHTNCCKERPVLLLMDNHDTHVNIDVVYLARENGIVILTFPPHCSHKLQPLDRTVFGPFKHYYNEAASLWMVNHPGQPISIYDVAGIAGVAYPQAFVPQNVTA